MQADKFVETLRQLTPTTDELVKLDKSERTVERWKKCFDFKSRRKKLVFKDKNNAITDLLTNWSCQTIKIGMVSFSDEPVTEGKNLLIGTVESDLLTVTSDSSIVVFEYGNEKHKLWDVAKDAEHFLDALVVVAKRMSGVALDKIDPEDDALSKKIAKEASEKAGGAEYLSFYLMLFGC